MNEGRKEVQGRKCAQNVTFWRLPLVVVATETQQDDPFYCSWRICGCQQYKSVHFCYGNATMCSFAPLKGHKVFGAAVNNNKY